MKMRLVLAAMLSVIASRAGAQSAPPPTPGNETTFAATVRREREDIAAACRLKFSALFKCPATFAMGKPFHLAFGSMPPGNGIALGGAFVYHELSSNHDKSWSLDAIMSPNKSWKSGVVRDIVFTKPKTIGTVPIGTTSTSTLKPEGPASVGFFGQGIEFKEIALYNAAAEHVGAFAQRQFSAGVLFNLPVAQKSSLAALDATLSGDVDMRHVKTQTDGATFLTNDRYGFSSLSGSIAIRPHAFDDRLRLHYEVSVRHYIPLTSTMSRVERVTYQLNHELGLYGVKSLVADDATVARNDCPGVDGNAPCPITSKSRNQYGSIRVNAYASMAFAAGGRDVPFFLQETLGGTDINGRKSLVAFKDYRFRGQKVASLSAVFEHYLYSIVGLSAMAETGMIAGNGQSLRWASRHQSVGAGVSLRVGALPVAQFLVAKGTEGKRFVFLIDAALLGGSKRPAIQ